MVFELSFPTIKARLIWSLVILAIGLFFIKSTFLQFIIATEASPQIGVNRESLEVVVKRFPNSAIIHTRLAARLIEAGIDRNKSYDTTARQALEHSLRAVQLAPSKYEAWVLLSAARELVGDLPQAEKDLRKALAFAPHRTMLHWRLANLLLREENLAAAVAEFRIATSADVSLLSPTLRVLWQATNGDLSSVASVVNQEPASRLLWANFLVEQSQALPAIDVFNRIDRQILLKLPGSSRLLNSLIVAKEFAQADRGWQYLFGQRTDQSRLWNGSFELAPQAEFNQFDWQFSESRYARIGVTNSHSRTGKKALSLAYLGIETTRLETEIKQLVPVHPNQRYRLECYAKTDSFVTTEGPRLVVTTVDGARLIAETTMVSAGTAEWQPLTVDFIAPAGASALSITIKQTPRYSYSAPTRGTVWFDDFSLQEHNR